MKRVLAIALSMLLILGVFAGCNSKKDSQPTEPSKAPVSTTKEETTEPLEGIVRINIFETQKTKVTDNNGAFSLKEFVEKNFVSKPSGKEPVTIVATDGFSMDTTADKVLKTSVSITSDNGPMLSDKDLNVKDILYIQFEHEVLLFAEKEVNVGKLLEALKMDTDSSYTFYASDGFKWATLDGEDTCNSVITPVEKTVHAAVPSVPEAGFVRGCVYFVPGHVPGAASAKVK